MIEGAAEWAVFTDDAVFGEPVVYTPAGQPDQPINGIFSAAHQETSRGGFPGVSTVAPVLTVGATQLPAPPQAGDVLLARGTSYRVADVQPDGSGLYRLILERN